MREGPCHPGGEQDLVKDDTPDVFVVRLNVTPSTIIMLHIARGKLYDYLLPLST